MFFDIHDKKDLHHEDEKYEKRYLIYDELLTYRGDDNALTWPDWYCKVASNVVSAMTTLSSIFAREAVAFSYFSCIHTQNILGQYKKIGINTVFIHKNLTH